MAEGTSPRKEDLGPGRPGSSWSVATARKKARRPVIELAPAAGRGEHWRPVTTAIIAVAGLPMALPPGTGHSQQGWSRPYYSRCQQCWSPGHRTAPAGKEPGCGSSPASSSRCAGRLRVLPGSFLSCPFHGPRLYLGPFEAAPQDTQARKEQQAPGWSRSTQLSPAAQRGFGSPFTGRARQPTVCAIQHRLEPPMEEFPAAMARAACRLAGALIVPLSRAFLATPCPRPAIGPARHPAGPTEAQACSGSAQGRPLTSVRNM